MFNPHPRSKIVANHANIETKRPMTPEAVTELLHRMNREVFKGGLHVAYQDNTNSEHEGWGPHQWEIEYIDKTGEPRGGRICWLNDEHNFEIRHGGGTKFIWWIALAVCNEICLMFSGSLEDEGVGVVTFGIPGLYDSFDGHIKRIAETSPHSSREFVYQMWMQEAPPEHRPKGFVAKNLEVTLRDAQEMSVNLPPPTQPTGD